ncbi:MAG: iron ABC transporter permease [Christensenellaceae bacterium]|jgi:iron complex transport system permease protein|nr:iron ABC transporter permease [Christensenellaceae bacterium]
MKGNARYPVLMSIFICGLIAAFFLSFLIGRYPIAPKTVTDIALSRLLHMEPYWESTLEKVVLQVRLPRILLAILVGGSLSMAGASYQTLFKNPMVSPDILGVSAGAGFGAAFAMLQNSSWAKIQLFALAGGLAAVGLAYLVASLSGRRQDLTILILGGVVTSSLFQSLLSVIKTLADTDSQLPSITFWLMGSLGKGNNQDVLVMLPAVVVSISILFLFRNRIDALSAGEDEALSMGVNVPLVKLVVIICSTLLTVVSVSICGIIGWVGMVVPHIARALTGASYGRLSSLSFLIGALFLLIIDNIIRGIPGVELPLGVMTALIGTPVFAVMLARVKKGW